MITILIQFTDSTSCTVIWKEKGKFLITGSIGGGGSNGTGTTFRRMERAEELKSGITVVVVPLVHHLQ